MLWFVFCVQKKKKASCLKDFFSLLDEAGPFVLLIFNLTFKLLPTRDNKDVVDLLE